MTTDRCTSRRRRAGRLALGLIAVCAVMSGLVIGCGGPYETPSPWSAPTALGCARPGGQAVGFPRSSPFDSSGPGMIAWTACTGARAAILDVGDRPGSSRAMPGGASGVVALTSTGSGRVLVGLHMPGGSAAVSQDALLERLGAPASPVAMATSYVGDAAVVSLTGRRSGVVTLRLERHGATALGSPIRLTDTPAPVTALAVSLDYRGDVLTAWQQQGAVYARELRVGHGLGLLQRVGPSAERPSLATLVSDDGRGMVAWLTQPPPTDRGGRSAVYLNISGSRVSFGEPQIVEAFGQQVGERVPSGALRLARLASESVLLAWTGMTGRRYAVRAAPVSLRGLHPTTTLSPPNADAVLADLASGPRSEAIAVWRGGPPNGLGAVTASRGVVSAPGIALFHAPEAIVGPGANTPAAVAIDPASDRTVAVWRAGRTLAYAIRAASPHGL